MPDALAEKSRGRAALRVLDGGQAGVPRDARPAATAAAASEIPLMGRIAAGVPIAAISEVSRHVAVPGAMLSQGSHYALEVRGDSMRDAGIMDGDLLAVQSTREAKNGQIIVARLGDDVTVKRFRRNKHLIELHAENPDYPTIVVEPGEPFEIEGLAVGLIRNTMLM